MTDTSQADRLHDDIERISSVLDSSPIGVAVWSVDGRLVHANPVFCELSGRPREELEGVLFEQFVHPTDAEVIVEMIADVWAGRRNYFECDLRCRDPEGKPLWLRSYLVAVYGARGEPEYLISQVFNFAGRGAKEARRRQLADESPVMLWLADERGRPRLGNKKCFEFVGVHPSDSELGGSWVDAIHPGDLEAAADEIHQAVATQQPIEFQARSRRRDGEWRRLRHHARPIFDADGRFEGYAGASIDVTGWEQIQLELDDSQRLFESLSEAGPVAVVRTDTGGRITYLNGRWADLVSDHETRLTDFGWRELLRPDDFARILQLGQESIETGRPFIIRVRALDRTAVAPDPANDSRLPDYWGELRAAPLFGPGGEHTGFAATLTDVSVEVEAAERADRLAQVLDASLDYVVIAAPTGALTYANGAATGALGLRVAPTEPDGAFLWDALDRDSVELYYDVVEPMLADDGVWRGELTMQSADGRALPVSAQVLAQVDSEKRLESVSLVARDISDIKAAEAQLRELATHDKLTGLANRALLYDRLDQALARFQRLTHGVALMYCDLDNFKPVNDRLGHAAGDAVLVEIADRVRQVVRDTDTAARVGGDEFVVLVEGVSDLDLLEAVANRLIESIGRPIELVAGTVEVGVSVGLVMAEGGLVDADRLMNLADRAMYRAKAGGRARLEVVPSGSH